MNEKSFGKFLRVKDLLIVDLTRDNTKKIILNCLEETDQA